MYGLCMLLLYILHLWGILHIQFLTVLRPYKYIYKAAINLVTDVPVADVNEYLNSTVTDAKFAGLITQGIH